MATGNWQGHGLPLDGETPSLAVSVIVAGGRPGLSA